ncbi:hypothetical protein ACFY2J_17410 [Streptomyces collinus]|uniref:hypothetical protein n=1 Tax=Streptomyces collinus TaxID=42684 RepID=UPI003688479D
MAVPRLRASSVIRSSHRYRVGSTGRRDTGHAFLVDLCGTLYEGRAGVAAKAVPGARTPGPAPAARASR